jgi:hypothetical protein
MGFSAVNGGRSSKSEKQQQAADKAVERGVPLATRLIVVCSQFTRSSKAASRSVTQDDEKKPRRDGGDETLMQRLLPN